MSVTNDPGACVPPAGRPRHIVHPGAWKGADFDKLDDITFVLQAHHLDALHRGLEFACRGGHDIEALEREHFPLDAIADDLTRIRNQVQHGRGIVLLRGLPVERYSREDMCRIFWGLGSHFGRAVSQSLMGDRLGHVTDVSGDNPDERGYRSRRELDMHTDSDDILMMMCLQSAKSGGQSRFVSALSVYNELIASHPELLAPLERGFHYHWRGEQAEGEEPVTRFRVPVFSHCRDLTSCVYLRAFIDMAAQALGDPLSNEEKVALDTFERLCQRSDLQLALQLEPGDAYLVNNYTVLHSRSAFEDHSAPECRRHLLRLWLKAYEGRPVVEPVRRFYRDDGISKREGSGTVFVRDYA